VVLAGALTARAGTAAAAVTVPREALAVDTSLPAASRHRHAAELHLPGGGAGGLEGAGSSVSLLELAVRKPRNLAYRADHGPATAGQTTAQTPNGS
jgi:hypothetical protein